MSEQIVCWLRFVSSSSVDTDLTGMAKVIKSNILFDSETKLTKKFTNTYHEIGMDKLSTMFLMFL